MDSRDSAAFRWGATAVVWLLGIFAVAPLVGGHPIAVAAQVVIEVAPGPVATVAIETLGGLAQPALMAGIGILAVATAAGIAAFAEGYGTNRRQQRLLVRAVTVVVVVLTAAGFRAAGDGIVWRWTLATAIALAGPALLRVFREEDGRPSADDARSGTSAAPRASRSAADSRRALSAARGQARVPTPASRSTRSPRSARGRPPLTRVRRRRQSPTGAPSRTVER
ncbi:hypothetical protein ACFQL4_15110 [Halosimplex aquaticum]